jgi:hypothetical protein
MNLTTMAPERAGANLRGSALFSPYLLSNDSRYVKCLTYSTIVGKVRHFCLYNLKNRKLHKKSGRTRVRPIHLEGPLIGFSRTSHVFRRRPLLPSYIRRFPS